MEKEIYLDNAATTRPRPEVIEAISRMLEIDYGNPSSPHRLGLAAERAVKKSRRQLARAIGAKEGEISFTSGGTEANNWALRMGSSLYSRFGKHLITSAIEHPSVLKTCQELEGAGYSVTYLPVDKDGRISINDLEAALQDDTILVSLMYVNNEVGSIQPVAEAGRLLERYKDKKKDGNPYPLFHVDAVQALGKLPLDVKALAVDLMSFSSHKLYGPKGSGALYKRKGIPLPALLTGGEQEEELRSGTENVPGIAGFGKAVELAVAELWDAGEKMYSLKRQLTGKLRANLADVQINGPRPDDGVPHIINLSFPGLKAEVLVNALSDAGIFVSTRSACSTHRNNPSHVLKALGLKGERLESAIRLSFSPFNTTEEISFVADRMTGIITQLRKIMGGGSR
ncbi:MAG: cysteine desulfurase family protein [Halanaerobium sp.]|nr:cysteine desulfurase family protein [Halanaerobium sp.]